MPLRGLKLRRFTSHARPLAEHWFANPIQDIDVVVSGEYSGTADGACYVEFGVASWGYVKPRPGNPNPNVVANEKLASDIGFMLGLPVAPVVIRSPKDGWPTHTALSLQCLKSPRLWNQGPPQPTTELCQTLEALRVFWTLIGDVDHNQHSENLLYEVSDIGFAMAAIDHSYSFGHGGDALTTPASMGFPLLPMVPNESTRSLALRAIDELNWHEVERLFTRLVGLLLTAGDAKLKFDWLTRRRENIRDVLGL
jgi:hypothetical protein